MSVIIQVSELHFSTDDGFKVFENVHLHINRGELAFLIGPSHAGKSLLLGLLAAQIPSQQGQILVCGRNVARLHQEKAFALRRKIGFLPQHFTLLPKSAVYNITFKLRALGTSQEQAEEQALAALETVGLIDKLSTPATEFKAIDRLKLAIAISICNEPSLLLCDEPLNGLSPEEKSEAIAILERINGRGLTILVTAKGPLPPIKTPHRTILIADGRIEEE